MIWLLLLGSLLMFAGMAIWRRPKSGALVGLGAIYGFYQVSSVNFLIPRGLYKDGGNGTFADWYVWAITASFWIGILFLVTLGLKFLLRLRRRSLR